MGDHVGAEKGMYPEEGGADRKDRGGRNSEGQAGQGEHRQLHPKSNGRSPKSAGNGMVKCTSSKDHCGPAVEKELKWAARKQGAPKGGSADEAGWIQRGRDPEAGERGSGSKPGYELVTDWRLGPQGEG